MEGVDYSEHRSPAALVAAGKEFVVRYGGAGSSSKNLDQAEADALRKAGLWLVANVEGEKGGLLEGRAKGADWARRAHSAFTAVGMPADRPIYLSVDFDVSAAQWPKVADALRGAADVLGLDRVGVYGGYNCVRWAERDHVATWFWQTYAWSKGKWFAGNHLEQYHNGESIGGGDVDLDRSKKDDFGQWGQQGEDMPTADEIATAVVKKLLTADAVPWDPKANYTVGGALYDAAKSARGLEAAMATVQSGVKTVVDRKPVDEKVIADAVLAHLAALTPEAVADRVAEALAGSLASEIAAKLNKS